MRRMFIRPLQTFMAMIMMLFATNLVPVAAVYADELSSDTTTVMQQPSTDETSDDSTDESTPQIQLPQLVKQQNQNFVQNNPYCVRTINQNDVHASYDWFSDFKATVYYTGPKLCDNVTQVVSLNLYQTEGANWPTSGTQTLAEHDQVTISNKNLIDHLQVQPTACYYQSDLYFGATKYDGQNGQLPHYPHGVFGQNLIDSRAGGKACVTADGPTFIDLCGVKNDTYSIPTTKHVDYLVNGRIVKAGTYPATGSVTVTAQSNDRNYILNGTDKWTQRFTSQSCTVHQCVVLTSGGTATESNKNGFDFSESRATGHYDFTDNGLHVYTESNTSTDKVAAYKAVNVPLSEVGSPSLDYTSNNGIKPGFQLVIDFNNDGTPDGTLVGEPDFYGNNWWLTNGSAQFAKDGAPHNGGGSGSQWYGTLDEWLTAYPNAQVKAFGFSLGSGVKADGVLKSITFNCQKFTFAADKDLCLNITGTQTTVPAGYGVDDNGDCVVAGGKGGDEPTTTVNTPQQTVTATPIVKTGTNAQLANTGAGEGLPMVTLLIGLTVISLALGAGFAARPKS